MNLEMIITLSRRTLEEAILISAPVLIVGIVISVIVSILQVMTSIQEVTISTVPRLAAVAAVAGELMIGMGMGLTMELIFEGARFAGQILGFQFGYSLVNVIDPQSQVEISVLNFFHYTILLLIFLQGEVHHWLFRLLAHSFDMIPPGTAVVSANAASILVRAAGQVFLMGLQLAAPALMVTLMTDISLAFMAKASPQLPVLSVGLPAKMLSGYAAIWSSVVFWPALAHKWFYGAVVGAERLLKAMH